MLLEKICKWHVQITVKYIDVIHNEVLLIVFIRFPSSFYSFFFAFLLFRFFLFFSPFISPSLSHLFLLLFSLGSTKNGRPNPRTRQLLADILTVQNQTVLAIDEYQQVCKYVVCMHNLYVRNVFGCPFYGFCLYLVLLCAIVEYQQLCMHYSCV